MARTKSDGEPLVFVGFKADEETLEAIDALMEAAAADGVVARSKKSAVIRRALQDAARRLGPRKR